MANSKTEKIVTALMLTYAMSREEAKIYLGQYEGEILTEEMETIQNQQPPKYLSGWFRYSRRMAWLDGRNAGINTLFSRLMRVQFRETRYREKEVVRS